MLSGEARQIPGLGKAAEKSDLYRTDGKLRARAQSG